MEEREEREQRPHTDADNAPLPYPHPASVPKNKIRIKWIKEEIAYICRFEGFRGLSKTAVIFKKITFAPHKLCRVRAQARNFRSTSPSDQISSNCLSPVFGLRAARETIVTSDYGKSNLIRGLPYDREFYRHKINEKQSSYREARFF